jgi:vacuolar-type H+-ATPase subunit B/Vma2
MMRREVQEYMRASAKLFVLVYEEGALTLAERAVILSFAQEIEKKFLPSREKDDMPLSAALPNEWATPCLIHLQ